MTAHDLRNGIEMIYDLLRDSDLQVPEPDFTIHRQNVEHLNYVERRYCDCSPRSWPMPWERELLREAYQEESRLLKLLGDQARHKAENPPIKYEPILREIGSGTIFFMDSL